MPKQDHRPKALKPDVFWVLTVLARNPSHGYAIPREVEALSDGQLRLRPGPLYRRLAELLDNGWIEELDPREVPDGDVEPRRRVYGITERGKEAVALETKRMTHAVLCAESVGLRGGR